MFSKLKQKFQRNRPANHTVMNSRMFAAAQGNRLVDWPVSYQRINGDLFTQYVPIVLRARDLAINNESVIGIIKNMIRNVIGTTGFTLQSRAEPAGIRPELEELWREYCSRTGGHCTIDERSSARDLDILVLRSLIIDGEAFIHRVFDPDSKFGYRYEVLDALQIDPTFVVRNLNGGGQIFMGIELDSRNREVAYYWREVVCEQYFSGERIRIPASEIIHLYRKEFPSQYRGISMLAGAALNLRQLDDYRNAELVHAQIASCTMGVWEWNGQNQDDIITDAQADDAGEFVREIKPGIFPIAPRGYQAKFLQNSAPNSQFAAFWKAVMRSISNSLGLSYNKASGDYESVNYSSLREAALEDRETYGELQRFMIENWKSLQYRDFINACFLNGLVTVTTLAGAYRHQFFGRRFSWIDPQKEIAAKKEEIALMLTDPIKELEARGEDPADVIKRSKEWLDMLGAEGLKDFWLASFTGAAPATEPNTEETTDDQP